MGAAVGRGAPVARVAAVALGAGVVRRDSVLADGRQLFYYDDADSRLPPERAADARALAPRPATPTMRRDPLTGDWVAIAAARQHRVVLPPADQDPLAPQSPGNPSEVPAPYDVAVFENRSPAFAADDGAPATAYERPAVGRCEVICFSPEHDGSFARSTPSRARTVVEAWADRTRVLSLLPGVEQVFVFENRGAEIGVTLAHPHGQIYAYPFVTPTTRRLIDETERAGGDLFERVLAAESAGERVVDRGEHWTAYVPFAARWPIEIHLVPHRHVPDLAETTDPERAELARMQPRLLRAVDALYDTPTPYIAAWHQAPVGAGRDATRLHLRVTSPRRGEHALKYLAGSETAMGAWIADIVPEEGAARLRAALAAVDAVDADPGAAS